MQKVLALGKDGKLSYCSSPPEQRGKGRCPHIAHQEAGETNEHFLERIQDIQSKIQDGQEYEIDEAHEITQEEIDDLASQIDEIAGEKLTADNFYDVMGRLTPQQVADITSIAFKASPNFSLPIVDEKYQDENFKTKLYFANLPAYGISGKNEAIEQMFDKIGSVPTLDGEEFIDHNYQDGLTPHEYFLKQFSARDAEIHKSVGTAEPGYSARKLFYAMSDTMVMKDCGGPHINALHCRLPEGHVCEKCAQATQGGDDIHEGKLVGGWVSTNMSEALTQLSMKQKHAGSKSVANQINGAKVIMATLDGWSSSPIIQKMAELKTTQERREFLAESLKKAYLDSGIKQDDFNIQMVARKLTSYKRGTDGLRPVQDDECCDIVSMGTIGNANNIFKVSEMSTGYGYLTKPNKQTLKKDAANQILR